MKPYCLLFAILLSVLIVSCDHHPDRTDEGKTTLLDIDQVNKLAPYMVDLKKMGDVKATLDTVRIGDSTVVVQHRSHQDFSFKIMVDENDHPVMPDSITTMLKRGGGGWHTGNISTWCFGGCIMVNTQLCLVEACKPMDNACGCTPPACGVCELLECSSVVSGFITGSVVMR